MQEGLDRRAAEPVIRQVQFAKRGQPRLRSQCRGAGSPDPVAVQVQGLEASELLGTGDGPGGRVTQPVSEQLKRLQSGEVRRRYERGDVGVRDRLDVPVRRVYAQVPDKAELPHGGEDRKSVV